MPHIEVRFADGRNETRRLSRRNPIVVGRNPISDVQIEDHSIAPIHCRILWNGTKFEVAATTDDGVDVNGTLVKRKTLRLGDLIRVGSADLVVASSKEKRRQEAEAAQAKSAPPPDADDADEVELDDDEEDLSEDDWGQLAGGAAAERPPAHDEDPALQPDVPAEDSPQPDDQPIDTTPVILDDKPDTPDEPFESKATKTWNRVAHKKRPGEQDVLTSPLVLGLGGFALCLLLAAGAIWMLIGRENADRLYDAAVSDRETGRYSQAIAEFEQFLLEYPTDTRIPEVRQALGLTRIEQHANGASPKYDEALAAFDEFVRQNRDTAEFEELAPTLAEKAQKLASSANDAAIRTGERPYLEPAEVAAKLHARYAGQERGAEEAKAELTANFEKAKLAVRKKEYFDEISGKISAAIEKQDFITAYEARNDLLQRYPDFRENSEVTKLLTRALDTERGLIRPTEKSTVQSIEPNQSATPSVTLMGHTQARLGETSDGRLVIAQARDQLVGVDVVTGQPVWKTTVGLDAPFFPVAVDAEVPAYIAFDGSRNDLLMIERDSGKIVWRTHIGYRAAGAPEIAQGQVDLLTIDGHLVRLDLESGNPIADITFPQPLVGSPITTDDGEHLVAFGEQSTAYTLNLRSLETKSASFIGHPAGSLATGPQRLGHLVVVFENDQLDTTSIRAFTFDATTGRLTSAATERIQGTVLLPPMPRGNVLFIPSSPERITAFSVSDDPGQPPLTRLAGAQFPNPRDIPTFLIPGSDGLVWAAGSALRKLQLEGDKLTILPDELAQGRHLQPVQQSGEGLFVARAVPGSQAVYVSQADRDTMSGNWRCILGASIIAKAFSDKDVTLINDAGQVALVTPEQLAKPGFFNAKPLPDWDEANTAPLGGTSLANGHALVWQGGSPAKLWRINPETTVSAPTDIAETPQTAPIALADGVVLPLPGRLEFLPNPGKSPLEPYLLPVTQDQENAATWQTLLALDDESLAAITDEGTIRILRRRDEPRPHLAEVASAELSEPMTGTLATLDGDLVLANGNNLERRNPSGLRPVAEYKLPDAAQRGPWVVGNHIFVQSKDNQLVALDKANFQEVWKLKLQAPMASAPIAAAPDANTVWVAVQDGTLIEVAQDGSEQQRLELVQRLSDLVHIGPQLTAVSLAGSLLPVQPQAPAETNTADATTTESTNSDGPVEEATPDEKETPAIEATESEEPT